MADDSIKINKILVRLQGKAWYAQMPSRGPLRDAAAANRCRDGLVPTPFDGSANPETVREHVQRTYPNAIVVVDATASF